MLSLEYLLLWKIGPQLGCSGNWYWHVGVDVGFGSFNTAIELTEFLKEESKIRVLYSEEFEHAESQDIVDICFNLYRKHWNTWFFVDGANSSGSQSNESGI